MLAYDAKRYADLICSNTDAEKLPNAEDVHTISATHFLCSR
jgi:hypothetical protein